MAREGHIPEPLLETSILTVKCPSHEDATQARAYLQVRQSPEEECANTISYCPEPSVSASGTAVDSNGRLIEPTSGPRFSVMMDQADMVAYKDWLPWWAYNEEVGHLADKLHADGKVVSMQACVGPGLLPAKLAILLFWPVYIAVTVFGITTAKCTEDHRHDRLRCGYLIMVLIRLAVEFKCLRYVTIPYIQTLGRFQWMGVTIPFTLWLFVVGFMSACNLLDMMTDSFFAISASENQVCSTENGVSEIDQMWALAMTRMHLPFLRSFDYASWAKIIWITTLSQMVYPLIEGTPRCGRFQVHTPDYSVGSHHTKFINLAGLESNFGDCLYQLADATCMASLSVQQPEYPRARERLRRKEHQKIQHFDAKASLAFVRGALSEGMVSVGLVGSLENSPQVVLQSMVFAMSRAASNSNRSTAFETQTIISIALSSIMCFTKLWKTRVLLAFFWEVRGVISEERSERPGQVLCEEARSMLRQVKKYVAVLVLWAILLCLCLYVAISQLIATTITCKGLVWLPFQGCVDLASQLS